MARDGAWGPNTIAWVAIIISAVSLAATIYAISQASAANSIALQSITSTVKISSVGREVWRNKVILRPLGPETDGQSHADLEVAFTNQGGLPVSLDNAELFERWETGDLGRTPSAESWTITENVGKLECTHKDTPIELPFDIGPGLSRRLRFSAEWTSVSLPHDFDSELLERIPNQRGMPHVSHSLVWKFYFSNKQIVSYDSNTISGMTNTP